MINMNPYLKIYLIGVVLCFILLVYIAIDIDDELTVKDVFYALIGSTSWFILMFLPLLVCFFDMDAKLRRKKK